MCDTCDTRGDIGKVPYPPEQRNYKDWDDGFFGSPKVGTVNNSIYAIPDSSPATRSVFEVLVFARDRLYNIHDQLDDLQHSGKTPTEVFTGPPIPSASMGVVMLASQIDDLVLTLHLRIQNLAKTLGPM
jgi:hypothetical protein